MKRISVLAVAVAAALGVAFLVGGPADADTTAAPAQITAPSTAAPAVWAPAPLQCTDQGEKKCSFDSDCPHGKCKSGKCGGCGFDSDCKGWGKCKDGWCGSCGFDSDCKDFGGCSSGQCKKSPY